MFGYIMTFILFCGLIIAIIWTAWGVHRLTQQIQRLSDETNKKDKQ